MYTSVSIRNASSKVIAYAIYLKQAIIYELPNALECYIVVI